MITPEQIAEWRRVAEAATPGPWMRHDTPSHYGVRHQPSLAVCRSYGKSIADDLDMDYIALFNPETVGEMLDEITALREALGRIEGMDSHIDATPRGTEMGRPVVRGPIAQIAHRALGDSQ